MSKEFYAQVGHSDLIVVGKAKGKSHVDFRLVFDDAVKLSAHISARFFNLESIFSS